MVAVLGIDDRLTQIRLSRPIKVGEEVTKLVIVLLPKEIAKIKQAFVREGWHEPVTFHSRVAMGKDTGNSYMTGAEWLKRFEKEVNKLNEVDFGNNIIFACLQAAKRASNENL